MNSSQPARCRSLMVVKYENIKRGISSYTLQRDFSFRTTFIVQLRFVRLPSLKSSDLSSRCPCLLYRSIYISLDTPNLSTCYLPTSTTLSSSTTSYSQSILNLALTILYIPHPPPLQCTHPIIAAYLRTNRERNRPRSCCASKVLTCCYRCI